MSPPKAGKAKEPNDGREGKKAVVGYFDPKVSSGLKRIGLAHGEKSIQDLVEESLKLLFKHYREPWPLKSDDSLNKGS